MKIVLRAVLVAGMALAAAPAPAPEARQKPGGAGQFAALMERVAAGWNEGNAKRAADCFSEDAIYSSPGGKIRRGRKALYEFFGGAKGRPAPMHMEWHHLGYDAETEIGFGEYTFAYKNYQAHGVAVVRTRNGEIRNWREYEIASKASFEKFVGENAF